MTSVIPMARMTVGALLRRMSTRLPKRWPSRTWRLKNPGTKMKSNSRISPRATDGSRRRLSVIRLREMDNRRVVTRRRRRSPA
jgi:hypothetical protein